MRRRKVIRRIQQKEQELEKLFKSPDNDELNKKIRLLLGLAKMEAKPEASICAEALAQPVTNLGTDQASHQLEDDKEEDNE